MEKVFTDPKLNSLLLVDCAARSLHELDVWFCELGLLRRGDELHPVRPSFNG